MNIARAARVLSLAAAAAAAWWLCSLLGENTGLALGKPGSLDFVQYWSAYRIMDGGGNPYDGVRMHAVQAALGQSADKTIMMWNPPWTAALLLPLVTLPFPAAAMLWFICGIAMLCALAVLIPDALGKPHPPLVAAAAAVILFVPVAECLSWGQLSIMLTFFCVLFVYFERQGRFGEAGLALVPLTIKPHLFFLFAVPALAWFRQLSWKQRRSFLAGSAGGLLLVVAFTALRWPQAIGWWLESLAATPAGPGVVAMDQWKTATLATLVRTSIGAATGHVPDWPMWAIPLAALLATAAVFAVAPRKILWSSLTPPLLCLSLSLGSYGWFYDQTLLVVCQVGLVCDAMASRDLRARWVVLTLLGAIQLAAGLVGSRAGSTQDDFVWLPWAMLGAWFGGRRLLRATGGREHTDDLRRQTR